MRKTTLSLSFPIRKGILKVYLASKALVNEMARQTRGPTSPVAGQKSKSYRSLRSEEGQATGGPPPGAHLQKAKSSKTTPHPPPALPTGTPHPAPGPEALPHQADGYITYHAGAVGRRYGDNGVMGPPLCRL